jgi:putative endonuclease
MTKAPCVYLLARSSHGTLYTGVTSDLIQRIHQHRDGVIKGHTARYGIKRLVLFEQHENMDTAILREKQIKRWARAWKCDLVNSVNPTCGIWPRTLDSIRCRWEEVRQAPGQARGDI